MADIIQLLPDNIANQIAAGEVIQRPASAVKELLENAVDAGATEIRLLVNDGGKSLVQVLDNGKGMSETDARMCFERHATSKIRNIDDLFHIRTMGFRGEALASIAAVAQVELKTKRASDETGTYLEIDNSVVRKQEPVACANGTCISMKNLFFNVPARRNFLKSNSAETRYIVDEFTRVSLAFPEIFFSLTSNGQLVFHLDKATLKQRIVQLLGNHYNAKLVSVNENTDYLNIKGFVGKPETSRKTRGDQYFFVNNRFIRSPYLNHAVLSAYQDMIASDSYPLYVLFIDLDPAQVDVNVHPTKQEIKFEDEKIVYAFVQAAVKHALAQFSIAPTLDFDLDPSIQRLDAVSKPITDATKSAVASSSIYQSFTQRHQAHFIEPAKNELQPLDQFFHNAQQTDFPDHKSESFVEPGTPLRNNRPELEVKEDYELFHLMNTYIVTSTNRGFLLIHQQLAHERILYERYVNAASGSAMPSQRSLFPVTLQLSATDAILLQELLDDLMHLGYQIELFGRDTFIIQGTPADIGHGNEKTMIESVLEQYKHFSSNITLSKREKLIRSLAAQHAIKPGTFLSKDELSNLVQELFKCHQPNTTAGGHPTFIEFKKEYLEQLFRK